MTPRGGTSRVWIRVAGFLAIVVATSAVSWWLGSRLDSPAARAARTAPPPPSLITVQAERRTLSEVVSGPASVRLTDNQAVTADGAEPGVEPVITAMPSRVGQRVVAGAVLYEIAGRPVFALPGAFPAYRDFSPGIEGPDVRQLQQALDSLGYGSGADQPGVFGAGTQRAVARFYHHAGYTAHTVPDGTGNGADWPRKEVAFIRRLPATVTSVAAGVGKRVDGTVLTLGLGAPQVQASVTPEDSTGLRAGQVATVADPSGHVTAAVVQSVGRIETDHSGQQMVTITLQPKGSARLRIGGDYTFRVELRHSGPSDYVVPVTALWTGHDERVMITVLTRDGVRHDIQVNLVLTVGGEAAVTPTGVAQLNIGDQVVVGMRGDHVVTPGN